MLITFDTALTLSSKNYSKEIIHILRKTIYTNICIVHFYNRKEIEANQMANRGIVK